MRVLVTGALGMLGQALTADRPEGVELLRADVLDELPPGVRRLDITDGAAVEALMATERPDAVINSAAYTAVDACEDHEELATAVNGTAPGLLARACAARGVPLLHVSTDYVFDGDRADGPAWVESDSMGPLSAYGRSKLAGEVAVRAATDAHWIVRTQWLYGLGGKNFVETMLALGATRDLLRVVDTERGSPTSTHTLSPLLWEILTRPGVPYGTYHAANAGACTWHGFAQAIFERAGMAVGVDPITSQQARDELGLKAVRPAYSVLDTSRLRAALGHDIPSWEDGLDDYVARRPSQQQQGTS
jgi:dTDP-4-dehydrorhamnose reductase